MIIRLYKALAITSALCVQSILFPLSAAGADGGITEQQIQTLLKAHDEAALRGDVSEIASSLAEDFVLEVNAPGPNGPQARKMTRDAFVTNLEKSFRQISNYRSSRDRVKISISPDGRSANVSDALIESWTSGATDIQTASTEEHKFELRQGKLLFVSTTIALLEKKGSASAARPKDCTYFSEGAKVTEYDPSWPRAKSGLFGVSPESFCRIYRAEAKAVSAAVQVIIPRLGNPIKVSDVANGFFSTDTLDHTAVSLTLGQLRYQDSYSISVQEERAGESVVRVLRTVKILRGDGRVEPWSSTGENENWILAQITDRLALRANTLPAAAAPSAPPAAATSIEDQLKKLKDLREKNLISEAEYKSMRAKALDAVVSPPSK